MGRFESLLTWGQDLRFALRQMRRAPGLVVTALLSLGLGIAFLTSVFALTDAFFLRALRFEEPERLVHIWQTDRKTDARELRVPESTYLDWREQSEEFVDIGGYYYTSYTLTGDGGSSKVRGTLITPNLMALLGVPAARGRLFTDEDLEATGGSQNGRNTGRRVVLAHRLWQGRFGGVDDIVGQRIELDGDRYTVVGVMPPDFVFPFNEMDLWVPLGARRDEARRGDRGPLLTVGRLAEGATAESAQAELDAIMARLEQEHPDTMEGRGANIVDLRSAMLFTWEIFRLVFPALFVAVGLVLLLVCANLGNLLLVRFSDRSREIAFRLTLGASRGRLVRQLLSESLVLGALGGALGVGLAVLGARALERALPLDLYRVGAISVDVRALGFASAACLLTVLLFGLAPALRSVSPQLASSLRSGGQTGDTVESRRLRNLLVVAQIALAVLLVAGAGLMTRTFVEMQKIDLGFEVDGLWTLEIVLPVVKYEGDAQENAFYDEVEERIRALPGVAAATSAYPLQLNFEQLTAEVEVEGRPASPDEVLEAGTFWVSDDYFHTLGIPLLAGRVFDGRDAADGAPALVVNDTLAQRLWPGEPAVGRRLLVRGSWREVVGVVADSVPYDLNEPTPMVLYYPQEQVSTRRRFVFVRADEGGRALMPEIRSRIAEVDPALPVTNVRSMEQVVATSYGPWLMGLGGIGLLGFGALVLAGVGLYGLVSYTVGRRLREFGVRKALGAQRRDVLLQVLGQSARLAGVGLVLGLLGVVGLSRFLQSLLYGVSALDPLALLAVPVVLGLAVLVASLVPARRAARVSPSTALRYE